MKIGLDGKSLVPSGACDRLVISPADMEVHMGTGSGSASGYRPSRSESTVLYLLSALLMMVGCYLVEYALKPTPHNMPTMLAVMGVLNLYEFCLIGLGVWLLNSKQIVSAGRILILLAIVFLSDSTYLNTAAVSSDPTRGSLVSAVVLSLAVVKAGITMRFLRIRFSTPEFLIMAATLLVLLGMPGLQSWFLINRYAPDGKIPEVTIYAGWWLCGTILALLPTRLNVISRVTRAGEGTDVAGTIRDALLVIPFLSVVAHLLLACGQYDRPWHVCYMSPILFGLAVFRARSQSDKNTTREMRVEFAALVGSGILFSLYSPEALAVKLLGIVLAPFRLALLAAALTSAIFLFLCKYRMFAVVSLLTLVFAAVGHDLTTSLNVAGTAWTRAARCLPRTAFQWGVTAIAISFLLLGLGVLFTLTRASGQKKDSVDSDIDKPAG